MDNTLDINKASLFVSAEGNAENTENSIYVQNDKSKEAPFHSRFKNWLKIVAWALILIFVPEQVSWAISYNPAVLWSSAPVSMTGTALPVTAPGVPTAPVF